MSASITLSEAGRDYTGGDFRLHCPDRIPSHAQGIRPACKAHTAALVRGAPGKLVAFLSENVHSLSTVLSGVRVAAFLWMTCYEGDALRDPLRRTDPWKFRRVDGQNGRCQKCTACGDIPALCAPRHTAAFGGSSDCCGCLRGGGACPLSCKVARCDKYLSCCPASASWNATTPGRRGGKLGAHSGP